MNKQLEKIVMVGPVYPFKGGISHYTGLMHQNLSETYDVQMVSYEVQYPKILFRKPQKDYENDTFKIDDTQFLLHTANPFNWKKTAQHINDGEPDLVIIQWWHPYFTPCYNSLAKHLSDDIKVLFVCHNVFPHERFPLDRQLTRSVLKKGDYFIVHSEMDADDLQSIKPGAVYERAVLPTYNAFKFTNMDKETAREQLGIDTDEKVLLFFGFVREYKGLRHLIAAMPEICRTQENLRLMIVGDFGSNKEEYEQLIADTGVADAIDVHGGYIPDREVEKFFAASDLVVLPYISATQSAVTQIAYGFDKPVVVTNVGGLPEVVLDGKTGYVVPPEDPAAIAEAVETFFEDPSHATDFEQNVKQEAHRYEWDRMRETIERLYKQ